MIVNFDQTHPNGQDHFPRTHACAGSPARWACGSFMTFASRSMGAQQILERQSLRNAIHFVVIPSRPMVATTVGHTIVFDAHPHAADVAWSDITRPISQAW